MEEKELDVKEVVIPAEGKPAVEAGKPEGDDKDKNFASLRKKLEETEKELARVKAEKEKEVDRSLAGDEPEVKKPKADDTLKVIFERDVKEATRLWNKKTTVSSEEWAQIKSKVQLKGDETQSEIQDKIQEAYESLPGVRQKRDKELIEKGKRLAMSEFSDDELDMGGGGDVDLGGGGEVRVSKQTKTWATRLGLSEKEIKEVDTESNPNEWSEGKQATRKFFHP